MATAAEREELEIAYGGLAQQAAAHPAFDYFETRKRAGVWHQPERLIAVISVIEALYDAGALTIERCQWGNPERTVDCENVVEFGKNYCTQHGA